MYFNSSYDTWSLKHFCLLSQQLIERTIFMISTALMTILVMKYEHLQNSVLMLDMSVT